MKDKYGRTLTERLRWWFINRLLTKDEAIIIHQSVYNGWMDLGDAMHKAHEHSYPNLHNDKRGYKIISNIKRYFEPNANVIMSELTNEQRKIRLAND